MLSKSIIIVKSKAYGGVGMSTVIKILSNCPFYKRECEECRHWDEEKMEYEMAILQDRKI